MNNFTLYNDDCLKALKLLEDNSVDSCVTDPPYGLSFMGKHWDYDVPSKEIWEEVYRVLKPGGYLLSFGGSRTYHRMAVAIEDAGFEIRDQIMWIYGSGFPKSHNIAKELNKKNGVSFESSPASGVGFMTAEGKNGYNVTKNKLTQTGESCDEAKQWEGWGTALKPSHEPIVMARKPLSEKTVAENVLKHGTGAINIDETRVPLAEDDEIYKTNPHTKGGFGHANANIYSDSSGAPVYDPSKGRWPANIIHDGSEEVLEGFPRVKGATTCSTGKQVGIMKMGLKTTGLQYSYGDDGSASRFFYCAKSSKSDRDEGLEEFLAKKIVTFQTGGGASGKPSSISAGRDTEYRNHHPTVKPTELMKYLVKLVTQKNGIVLDPFMGSGTTGKACGFEGYNFIGIEREKEYFEIAQARIEHAYKNETVSLEKFFE